MFLNSLTLVFIVSASFNKAVDKIRFKVNCKNPSGDRNKGRVCLGDLYVY